MHREKSCKSPSALKRVCRTCPVPCLVLTFLLFSGCSHLILRDDDTAVESMAKVAARVVLAIPTFLMSEVAIADIKEREEKERALNSWLGATKATLIDRWGVPSRDYAYSGGNIVRYEFRGPTAIVPIGGMWIAGQSNCWTEFQIGTDDRIRGWRSTC